MVQSDSIEQPYINQNSFSIDDIDDKGPADLDGQGPGELDDIKINYGMDLKNASKIAQK